MKRLLPVLTVMLPLSVFLSTQERSIAGSEAVASHSLQVNTAALDAETTDSHTASVVRRVRPRQSRLRTFRGNAVNAAAAAPAVLPKAEPVLLPAIHQSDANTVHKTIANEVLMALPKRCRATLQNFYVRYEKQPSRGLAGKSVIILDGTVKNDVEFRSLFIHETGHNWDLGCFTGTLSAGSSAFSDGDEVIYNDDLSTGFYKISWVTSSIQRSTARPEDFVSGYAGHDVFEDFAESFAYFVLQNAEFAERAKTNAALEEKYLWFSDILFEGKAPRIATGNAPFEGKVPWDVTKLAYVWHPEREVASR